MMVLKKRSMLIIKNTEYKWHHPDRKSTRLNSSLAVGEIPLGNMTKHSRRFYLPYIRMGIWPGFVALIVYVILLIAGTR